MDDGGAIIFNLLIGLVMGAIAASIANSKGRSTVGWFFGGFFLGLIGIIIVACLSNLKQEEAMRMRDQQEKRRLREQLRQEQLKSESYRQYTMERLDAHDEHLGIDTRDTQVALPGASPVASGTPALLGTEMPVKRPTLNVGAAPQSEPSPGPGAEWYYSSGGESREGPFTIHEIQQLAAIGEVSDSTLVWGPGMADWTAFKDVPGLQAT